MIVRQRTIAMYNKLQCIVHKNHRVTTLRLYYDLFKRMSWNTREQNICNVFAEVVEYTKR